MNANTEYEIKAQAFRIMTGQIAPGKDVPSCGYSEPYGERVRLWAEWHTKHGDCINAMLRAANDHLDEPGC